MADHDPPKDATRDEQETGAVAVTNDVGDYAQLFAAVMAAVVLLVSAASIRQFIAVIAMLSTTASVCNLFIFLYRKRLRLTTWRVNCRPLLMV